MSNERRGCALSGPDDIMCAIEDELGIVREPKPCGFFTVAIYDVSLQWGGAEEGGWWFDAGDRCNEVFAELGEHGVPRVFTDRDEAIAWRDAIDAKLPTTLNAGKRPKHSVLSNGVYEAHMFDGFAPEHFPPTRPHYE